MPTKRPKRTKPNHTPGPWEYKFGNGIYIATADDKVIICDRVEYTNGVGDVDCNARLIASAPDMLAAHIEAADRLRKMIDDVQSGRQIAPQEIKNLVAVVDAAINRATKFAPCIQASHPTS